MIRARTVLPHALLASLCVACATPAGPAPEEGQGHDAAPVAAAQDHAPRYVEMPNFVVLDADVAGGGQPALDEIADLRARGYSMIINLQQASEDGVAAEAEAAERAGILYVHLPVSGGTMDISDARAVSEALRNAPPGDVLLHCRSGGRVAMMWGMVRGLEDGLWPDEAAWVAQHSGRPISDAAAEHVAEQLRVGRD